jgi:manganese transport protein
MDPTILKDINIKVLDFDPYHQDSSKIKEPPVKWSQVGKHLGPGFVLSAAIVGSGELIAATALGAQAGFITFWVILVSCMVKVVLQLEFGKHAIHSGEPTMASFNKLPGPKLGKGNWSIWIWLFIQLFKLLQLGGIVGGVAITLHIAFPFLEVTPWAIFITLLTSLIISIGYYNFIEKASLVMIALFTILTLVCTYALQFTPYAISWDNIATGLSFSLPPAYVGIALAAFGITGVGGDEIMYYNYWCIEKGYAAYTGPKENTPEWKRRAKGWIRIMYIDAILAMVVYTIVTAAFYLLGAAVLHSKGMIPEGYQMVETLSQMYTETLGPWAMSLFMIGAIVVLYSTMFTATASWTRIFSDAFGQIGLINFNNQQERRKTMALLAWIFPITWCILFIFIQLPILMILIGGFVTSILLLLVVYAAIHFRYKRLPASLKPTLIYDVVFWLSACSIVMVGIYGIIKVIS